MPLQTTASRHGLRLLVHLSIIERSEGGDHGDAESFLARNQIAGEHPPGALGVANADGACESVDGFGEFDAAFEYFVSERLRKFERSGATEVSGMAIRDVGPAFEEDVAGLFGGCRVRN